MAELSKEERIKNEKDRLIIYFEKLSERELAIITPMIENAAFMRITLEDLRKVIIEEGVTERYQNGANQFGNKQSASLQAYNMIVKTYSALMKNLFSYLPYESKQALTWQPKEKTPEEIEAEERAADERRARINAEIARAAEWQRQQREAEKNKPRGNINA